MATDENSSGSTHHITCEACGRQVLIDPQAAGQMVTCECGHSCAAPQGAAPLPTDLRARGEELRRRARANKPKPNMGRQLAMFSWAIPLVAAFFSGQVGSRLPKHPPGTHMTDPMERYLPAGMIILGALLGVIAAIGALRRVKIDGAKGVLGHAVFGLVANVAIVVIFAVGYYVASQNR